MVCNTSGNDAIPLLRAVITDTQVVEALEDQDLSLPYNINTNIDVIAQVKLPPWRRMDGRN